MKRKFAVITILITAAVLLIIGGHVFAATTTAATQVTFSNNLPAPISQHGNIMLGVVVPNNVVDGSISVDSQTGIANSAPFVMGDWETPNLANAATSATVTASGILTEDTVWDEDILVTGDLIVPVSYTLTIEPGVTVLFAANSDDQATEVWDNKAELFIQGRLTAVGTPTQPIIFTSDAESPTAGDWGAIRVHKNDLNIHLAYCGVQYAEYGIYFRNYKLGSGLTAGIIDHCTIQQNNHGINIFGRPGTSNGVVSAIITATHNLIQQNEIGISIIHSTGSSGSTYDYSTIYNNRIQQNDVGMELFGNHWGTGRVKIQTEISNNLFQDNTTYDLQVHIKDGKVVVAPIIENNLFDNTSVSDNTHLVIAGENDHGGSSRVFSPTIQFNTFANANYGIDISANDNSFDVSPVIDHNIFYNFGAYAVRNTTDDTVSVEQNYWGNNEADWDSDQSSMVNGNLVAINPLDSNSAPILTYVSPGLAQSGDDVTLYGANFGSNTAPVSQNDAFSTGYNKSLSVSAPGVLVNDTDGNWNELTAVLDTNVTHGTLVFNSSGAFTYTPNTDFVGEDSFTYHAHDGQDDSTIATVNITTNEQSEFLVFLPMIVK